MHSFGGAVMHPRTTHAAFRYVSPFRNQSASTHRQMRSKIETQFLAFDPVKICVGVGEISESFFFVRDLEPNHWYTCDVTGRRLAVCEIRVWLATEDSGKK